jgi:hypothetical protein
MKSLKTLTSIAMAATILVFTGTALAGQDRSTGRGTGPVIYVTSQGLYYDSIVLGDLPAMKGRFQKLVETMYGLETEWGPGDYGHVGGRWWMDANGNGEMDYEDLYFMCPLLGPGREAP